MLTIGTKILFSGNVICQGYFPFNMVKKYWCSCFNFYYREYYFRAMYKQKKKKDGYNIIESAEGTLSVIWCA